jgi:hypothetical protein
VKVRVAVWRDVIRDADDLATTERVVAWCLATYMSADGVAWPSLRLLAAGCDLTDRTVGRAVTGLEEKGCLAVERSAGRTSHRYTAVLPATANELRRSEWLNTEAAVLNTESDAPNGERRSHEDVEQDSEQGALERRRNGDGGSHAIRDWCLTCDEVTTQERHADTVICLNCSTRAGA